MKITKRETVVWTLALSNDEFIALDRILTRNRTFALTSFEEEVLNNLRDKVGRELRGS